MTEEIPLICDTPPGAGCYVLTVPHAVSEMQIARIKEAFRKAYSGPHPSLLVLEPGMTLRPLAGLAQWPDAEHCAA